MGRRPDRSLHLIVAGPWGVRVHQARVRRGQDVVVRRDRTPYLGFGEVSFEIVFVIEMGQAAAADGPVAGEDDRGAGLGLIFTRPQRLARAGRIGGRSELTLLARIVDAHDVDCRGKRGILAHGIEDVPLAEAFVRILVAADDFCAGPLLVQYATQCFYILAIELLLVPDAGVGDVEVILRLRAVEEDGGVVGHGWGVERGLLDSVRTDPAGRAPSESVENDLRIAAVRFLHQPPFVTASEILILRRAHVAGLGTVGGVDVAADLDFQVLQRCAVVRQKKVVEHLRTIRLGIVIEQARGRAGADRAKAIEGAARAGGIDGDRDRLRPGRGANQRAEQKCERDACAHRYSYLIANARTDPGHRQSFDEAKFEKIPLRQPTSGLGD